MVVIMQRSDGKPKSFPPRTKAPALPYGVYARARSKPFLVKFTRNHRTINVGSFATLAEAAAAATNYLAKESR